MIRVDNIDRTRKIFLFTDNKQNYEINVSKVIDLLLLKKIL